MRGYDRALERREFLQLASSFYLGYAAAVADGQPFQYASVGPSSNVIAERAMIKLAGRYSQVQAVTRGNDPEEGFPVYYFLTPGVGLIENDILSDAMCDLELSLYNKNGIHVHTCYWPLGVDQVDEDGFIGDVIWQRQAA